MGSGYLLSPLMLIINTIFDLYILMVLLRFLLQMLRADFYNPVSQFIVRLTTPPLHLLRRIIPSIAGQDAVLPLAPQVVLKQRRQRQRKRKLSRSIGMQWQSLRRGTA